MWRFSFFQKRKPEAEPRSQAGAVPPVFGWGAVGGSLVDGADGERRNLS